MFTLATSSPLQGLCASHGSTYKSIHSKYMACIHTTSRTRIAFGSGCSATVAGISRLQRAGRSRLQVHSFLSVEKGLEKIKSLFDFNKESRLQTLKRLYGKPSRENCEEILAENFTLKEAGYNKTFSKADYMRLLCDVVLPSVPDFSWGYATTGEVDNDGYCIVTVQANGHHTGSPFALPGLPAIPPSYRHFCLAEEVHKVKVQDGKIVEMQVITSVGAGPRAMYAALRDATPIVI